MTEPRKATDEDIPGLVVDALEIADGWFADGPIEWESLFDRLESWSGLELPTDWTDPLFDKIKRRVRKERNASQ